jgi:ribosomal protein S4
MRFHKLRASRKYEDDIFGLIVRRPKTNFRVGVFLINLRRERKRIQKFNYNVFRIDLRTPKKLDKPHSNFFWRLILRNRLRYHFDFKRERQLKTLFDYTRIRRGDFGRNFGNYFEGRLDSMLIKCHFLDTMVQAREYIERAKILINDTIIPKHRYFSIKVGDCITLAKESIKQHIETKMIERFENNEIVVAAPPATEISWKLLRIKVWVQPVAGAGRYYFDLQLKRVYNNYQIT